MREHIPKTQAKSLYCLSDKDLAPLPVIQKKNPYRRAGPPMQLYKTSEVEALAAAKHGGLQGLAAEQSKRSLKRAARAEKKVAARAEAAAAAAAADAGAGAAGAPGPAGHLALPHLILERVRLVSPGPLQGAPPNPAAAAHPGDLAAASTARDMTGAAVEGGRYVMYWMQTAVRAYENPALDVAAAQARHLGVPLLVVAAMLQSHPYATARRYQFVLEGLREVQQQLQQQGVPLLVLCEGLDQDATSTSASTSSGATSSTTSSSSSSSAGGWWGSAPGSAGAATEGGMEPQVAARLNAALLSPAYQQHLANSTGWCSLVALGTQASLVVTEDMPVAPEAVWVPAAAAQLGAAGVPVWVVDTACVVPMRLTQRAYERAAGFRSATEGLRQLRATAVYPPAATAAAAATVGGAAAGQPSSVASALASSSGSSSTPRLSPQQLADLVAPLPCLPVDLSTCDLLRLTSTWPGLDQSVPPVTHMRGGTSAALQRWQQFKVHGLHLYAARRNDALQREGVSRLSAYHHYGMVSPFQVAREAKFSGGATGVKFLDEFLVWREIAYHFCFHRWPVLDTLEALPGWAAATLTAHAGDPRPQGLKSLAQLEAGTTGDAWWDAAQHQLVTTGELHNNVRMTWGKALLQWSSSPQAALGRLLHLNHRYALDGCDPASYGGVLWCFGQFDGPRQASDTPVTGSLRLRPTAGQAKRLPPEQYRNLPV